MPYWVDDVAAVVDAIGVRAPGVVWGLAMVDWPDAQTRDQFLRMISTPVIPDTRSVDGSQAPDEGAEAAPPATDDGASAVADAALAGGSG